MNLQLSNKKHTLPYLFLLFIIIFTFSCTNNTNEKPLAKKGILDLSEIDINNHKIINLKGEWELYRNKLLYPKDFKNIPSSENIEYVNVPIFKLPTNKNSLPNKGFATYRLLIKIDTNFHAKRVWNNMESLAIQTGMGYTSSRIWLNGKEVSKIGTVAKTKADYKSGVCIDIIPFILNSKDEYIEIIIQNSNFVANNNGIKDTYIGTYENIKNRFRNNILVAGILIGIILIISLYHFILYFIQIKKYSTLSFAFLTLVIGIRTIVENNIFLPEMSYELFSKISYLTATMYPALIVVFFYFLFTKEFHKKIVLILVGITAVLTLLIVFTKPIFYTHTDTYVALLILICLLYSIVILIKSIKNKQKGAWIALFGSIILFSTNINDIFYNFHYLQTTYLTHYGMVIYTIFQAINIAQRYSHDAKENLLLNQQLDYQNTNLSDIVIQRTSEISEKNEELRQQSEELKSQAEILALINKEAKQKSIFIQESINYAKTIQQAILPSFAELSKHFNLFVFYRPRDIVSGDFYWFNEVKNPTNLKNQRGLEDPTIVKFFAVIDCTGHGVPVAFMSMIINQILNHVVNEQKIYEPKEVLFHINHEIIKALRQEKSKNMDGLDIVFCRFNEIEAKKKQIIFAGAGLSLFRYSSQNHEIIRHKGHYTHIGGLTNINKKIDFTQEKINLQTNDIIYFTTDGIIDQNNSTRRRFGRTRLMKLFIEIAKQTMPEQKQIIKERLENWQLIETQRDDITLIGIKIN